jgi:CO/xanthine dehydrogenase Mo-binding subunit
MMRKRRSFWSSVFWVGTAVFLMAACFKPGPFGAKSVTEAGISIIVPAVVNAVYNATGVRIHEIPITSEKIVKGLSCRSQA